MTGETARMLTTLLSCSMAVTNVVPFHVMVKVIPGDPQEEQIPSTKNQRRDTKETTPVSLTNFRGDHVHSEGSKMMLDNTGGDNFAMSEDSKIIADDFHYSADLMTKSGGAQCAVLLVGMGDRNDPSKAWRTANVVRYEGKNKMRMPRMPGDHNYQPMWVLNGYNSTETIHLDLDIEANGDLTYKVTSEGGSENMMSGNMDDWASGRIGVLAFQTEAELSNTQSADRTVRADDSLFHTVLESLRGLQGNWKIIEKGMYLQGSGDNSAISDTGIEDFEYSANISDPSRKGARALMFRIRNPGNPQAGCYAIDADYTHNTFKLFEFPTGGSIAEAPLSSMEPNANSSYDTKVIVAGEDIYVHANGKGITREKDGRRKEESYLGLLAWDGNIGYQDLNHKAANKLPAVEEAKLSNFKILTNGVTITPMFDPNVKNYSMDILTGVDCVVIKSESSGDVHIILKDRNNEATKEK